MTHDPTTGGPATDPGPGSDVVAPDVLAQQLAAAVSAHPAVVRLDGGIFGAVATYLPGRRLVGVRVGDAGEPVEIAVVVRLDRPIPDTVAALRAIVATLHEGPVDITVSDVATAADAGDAGSATTAGTGTS